ncbi:hypothetical protein [Horticoccus sp. 23ND18S-11]|uniref:hypothetical protein n=1 Tax=Horticoccus sp. 23ND18S-11 TaxID=3391832 RepID=UPI0039C91154
MTWFTPVSPRFARVVRFDDEGFTIVAGKGNSARVPWDDVNEVIGFKSDLLTVDEICLGFGVATGGDSIAVGEEDIGFEEFRAETERRFGIDAAWFGKIMKPAFAANRTILWQRT